MCSFSYVYCAPQHDVEPFQVDYLHDCRRHPPVVTVKEFRDSRKVYIHPLESIHSPTEIVCELNCHYQALLQPPGRRDGLLWRQFNNVKDNGTSVNYQPGR